MGYLSEADVRHELISPLLKRVPHSMSEIVLPASNPEEQEYALSLVVESATERRLHTPGSKPTVDHCLVGRTERQILYKVPVEAKKMFTFNDMGQLAYYMGQLAKVGGNNTEIGLLMDETRLKIAVAPLCLSEGPLPLPIIILSPSVTWRDRATLKRDLCPAASTCSTPKHHS